MSNNLMFSDVRGVLNDLNEKLAGEKAYETLEGLKKYLRGENPFPTANVGNEFTALVEEWITKWKHFYKKYFHLDLDMTGVKIPAHVPGFDRLIIVAKGLSINHIYEVGKKNFSSWKWCDEDIESQMRESERGKTTSTYAIWVRDDREADEGTRNLSAEDISSQKIDTENLLERLIHGFEYWSEKGEHLDVDSVTLCAASRYAGGRVPGVRRYEDGRVNVSWYGPQFRGLDLGARRAVR